jgi:hypothetical protein
MPYKKTDKLIKYNNDFNKENYDRVSLMLPKGKKERIQEYVKQTGESVNGFINRLIDRELDNTATRDTAIPDSFGTETRSEENR